jgi:ligand-binding sensor domain-containing protein
MKYLATILLILATWASQSLAQNGVWVNYTKANSGLYSDSIYSIVVDKNHNLWLGTHKGLDQFDGTTWTSYYRDLTKVPSGDINDLNYSFDALWIAHGTGLTKYNGTTWQTYTKDNSGLVSSPVLELTNDYERVWVGTARGLGAIDDEGVWTQYTTTNTPAMPYNGINALTNDHDNLWMSFIGTAGLVKIPNGNSVQAKRFRTDTIPNMPQGNITSLVVDRNGDLWGGLALAGAVRINASGATQYTTQTTSAFASNKTHKVVVDHCGKIWVATEAGVVMYDGTNWLSVRKTDGKLINDTVLTAYVDPDGHVWFGTQGGLSEFKPLPSKPVLMSPANWAVVTTDSVTCRWNWACPNILKYWHEIADNPEFTNAYIDTTSASLMQSASLWDTILKNQTTYYWRVRAKNDAGWGPLSETWTFTVNKTSAVNASQEHAFRLGAIVPNPSTGHATIGFTTATRAAVHLALYDALGREVMVMAHRTFDPGTHSVDVNTESLPAGWYVYRFESGDFTESHTMQVGR